MLHRQDSISFLSENQKAYSENVITPIVLCNTVLHISCCFIEICFSWTGCCSLDDPWLLYEVLELSDIFRTWTNPLTFPWHPYLGSFKNNIKNINLSTYQVALLWIDGCHTVFSFRHITMFRQGRSIWHPRHNAHLSQPKSQRGYNINKIRYMYYGTWEIKVKMA